MAKRLGFKGTGNPIHSFKVTGQGSRKNTWMRLLVKSATYTLPVEGFTATPTGRLNWPSPEPGEPHLLINRYSFTINSFVTLQTLLSPAVWMLPLQSVPKCFTTFSGDDALSSKPSVTLYSPRLSVTLVPSPEPANEAGLGFPLPVVPVTRIVKSDGGGHSKPSGHVTFL